MYLSFYKLKVKPFQMSTDPNFLWLGEQHKEALATLKSAIIENKGILALTGDVGTGKTTLINALIQSLGEDNAGGHDLRSESRGRSSFSTVVASAFNMGKTFESKGQFINHFRQFSTRKAREGKQKSAADHRRGPGDGRGNARRDPVVVESRRGPRPAAEYLFLWGRMNSWISCRSTENRALRQRITIRYHHRDR